MRTPASFAQGATELLSTPGVVESPWLAKEVSSNKAWDEKKSPRASCSSVGHEPFCVCVCALFTVSEWVMAT